MSQLVSAHNIRLLKWFNFFLDFRPYAAIAIIYFYQVTGSYALGLSIYSFIAISTSIFEVPTGVLSDKLGRKKTIIIGAFTMLLGVIFYTFWQSYLGLAMGAILEGISMSFFSGNNEALLYDSLKSEKKEGQYSHFLGKTSAMFQLGLAISVFFGGFLAEWSLQYVFIASIFPQVTTFILAFFFIEPTTHYEVIETNIFSHLKEAIQAFIRNWKLRDISLSSIISHAVGETVHKFVPSFFELLWPVWALGIPRTLTYFFGFLSFHFSGDVIKKWGPVKTMLNSSIFNRCVAIIAYGIPTLISPILVAIPSLTFGLFKVSESTLMQQEFNDHQRATMGSLNSLFGNIFFAMFAVVFGYFADDWGPAKALLVGEVLLLVLLPIYWKLLKASST